MSYQRLAYDEADTVSHMQHDCEEVAAELHLPKQTTVATALDTATELAAGTAKTVRRTVLTVSDSAAKLAGRLLPF